LDVLKQTKSSKIQSKSPDQSVDKEEATTPKKGELGSPKAVAVIAQNNYYETNLIRNIKKVNLKIKTNFSVYDQTHSLESKVPFEPSTPL